MRMQVAVTGTMRVPASNLSHFSSVVFVSGSFEIIIFFIHLLEVLKTNEVVRNC